MRITLMVMIAALASARAEKFSLEQIMSSPFPSQLVAAPGGSKVAWVFNHRGRRNIWVAEGPEWRGRAVTAYTADDGHEISGLEWTPDGRIVYTRGGGANRQGEIPNPSSEPKGADQSLWIVSVTGGEPRRIAEGSSPAVSPKGDGVVYLSRGQIWWVQFEAGAKPAQLIKARGSAGSLTWLKDGTRLALVSSRGDHNFIGVYDVAGKSLRFLDASVDRDSNPAWSPDGRQVAFLRSPAVTRNFTFGPVREGEPWSIRVADVATGQGREVWRAQRGRGSVFHGVVAANQILWAAGDRIVFPWERDGWSHLYSAPLKDGVATLLTPGDGEVEDVTLTPDARDVIYSTNIGDIDRRHIFRVAAGGGKPVAVTGGKSIEWSPVVTADGAAITFLASDARRPAHAAVLAGKGPVRELAPASIPPDFPQRDLVEPEAVTFAAADGMPIHAQLFRPADIKTGERRPAAIFFHGGSRRQMLLGWHYGSYYHNAYALNQYLASRGFVVMSVNYRSGIGYGLEFREALNYGATGASEFSDVIGAGLYLRSRSDVDPKRIALWGGSYGGYLTAMGLARASDLFAAGVDIHGVHDWNNVIRNFVPAYDPQKQQAAAKLAFDSSPMASVKTWRSPVLLIHGDDDRNVPFNESVILAEALRNQGVEFEQLVFPDEVHSFLRHSRWLEVFRASADFLDRRLRR